MQVLWANYLHTVCPCLLFNTDLHIYSKLFDIALYFGNTELFQPQPSKWGSSQAENSWVGACPEHWDYLEKEIFPHTLHSIHPQCCVCRMHSQVHIPQQDEDELSALVLTLNGHLSVKKNYYGFSHAACCFCFCLFFFFP